MAPDVRWWGGYCRRTSSIAAVTLGAAGATLSTSICWPLAIIAIRRPVDTADIWPAHASAWACQACAPARRYRTPAAVGPPLVTRGGGGLGTLSPLHCLCLLCCWLRLAQRRHVALKSLHLGGQPVTLLGDVHQPRLAVPPVLVGPGQTGLEVAVGGLRADRACLPRPPPLLLHALLHRPPLPPPPLWLRLLRPHCPLRRAGRTQGLRGGGIGPVSPSGRPLRLRVGGSSSSSTSMTSATAIFRCLPTWRRMVSHATSGHSALCCSQPVSTFSPKTPAAVTVPASPVRATPVCTRQCPLTSR